MEGSRLTRRPAARPPACPPALGRSGVETRAGSRQELQLGVLGPCWSVLGRCLHDKGVSVVVAGSRRVVFFRMPQSRFLLFLPLGSH